MISAQLFKKKIDEFVLTLNYKDNLMYPKGSTVYRLLKLIDLKYFDNHENKEFDFFCEKYDISQKLFEFYDKNGRKSNDRPISQEGLQIFACLLYLRVLISINQDTSEIDRARYINICLKAFDKILIPKFLDEERHELLLIQDELFKNLPNQNLYNELLKQNMSKDTPYIEPQKYEILPIDVLFYEGPIGRAYLEMLYSLGCKPRRIINLIPKLDPKTKKKIGSILPSFIRYKYVEIIQNRKIHFWPKYLYRTQKKLCNEVFDQLQKTLKIKQNILFGALKLKPLSNYSNSIIDLPINSFDDPELSSFLNTQDASMYLFTGGGILPENFFKNKSNKFIHVHPGYLPNIKGADCLLWSVMLTGYPSATCFFMNSKIDTGDIIQAEFLPKIVLPRAVTKIDSKMNYRLIYSFIDPWVRAVVLRNTLKHTNFLKNINATPQDIKSGNTFHFMQEKMISKVIKNSF